MIFVGSGALLNRAVDLALARGQRVDLVCSNVSPDRGGGTTAEVPSLHVTDINAHAERLARECTDGIVWSINNTMIFRKPVLESGLRIYNIHNGLLPQHRGLSTVAVLFALLECHTEYGATLHEVDRGIDTGQVLAEHRFPICHDARYHEVLLRGMRACHQLFESNLEAVVSGRELPRPVTYEATATPQPGYYGLRRLRQLGQYSASPAFARATDLGPLTPFVPEIQAAIAEATSVGNRLI